MTATYEARLVAKTETLSGEYYIIGETGWPPAVAPASYTYVGRNAAVGTSIIFTAKMPGTDGNGLKVSGSSGSTSVSFSYNDNNNNTLTINYNSSVHTVADLVTAFAKSDYAAIAEIYEISFIGDDTNLLNNVLSIRSETLAGGGVATDPTQTGTVVSNADLVLVDTTTYEYVVVVNNLDDNPPVFETAELVTDLSAEEQTKLGINSEDVPATAFTYNSTTKTLSLVPEHVADNIVLLVVDAEDADGDSETIEYTLEADKDTHNALFAIDRTTGVVTVAEGTKLDYEKASQFTIKVTATSRSSLKGADPDGKVVRETYIITLTDENDDPTGAIFERAADFATNDANVGRVVADDDDRLTKYKDDPAGADIDRTNSTTDSWKFVRVLDADAEDGETTDTDDFTIDEDSGVLTFTGSRKNPGDFYLVRVKVTDAAGQAELASSGVDKGVTTILRIVEGTVTIGDQYSGSSELVDENADFAILGQLKAGTSTTPIELGASVAGTNDNADFFIMTTAADVKLFSKTGTNSFDRKR